MERRPPSPPQPAPAGDLAEAIRQQLEERLREMGFPVPSAEEAPLEGEAPLEETAVVSLEEAALRERGAAISLEETPRARLGAVGIRLAEEAPPARVERRPVQPLPTFERLSPIQRAVVWAEIFGRPLSERETAPTAPPGIRL